MKTELRVYSTIERLKYDFRKVVENAKSTGRPIKVIPNREIVINDVIKITFLVANDSNFRGWRPDSVIVDEMLPAKIRDYLFMSKKSAE